MLKKFGALTCSFLLVLSLAGCGSTTEESSSDTIMGRVTAVDGTTVTISVIEMDESAFEATEDAEEFTGEAPSGEEYTSEEGEAPAKTEATQNT